MGADSNLQTRPCSECRTPFQPYRDASKICGAPACKKALAAKRWQTWYSKPSAKEYSASYQRSYRTSGQARRSGIMRKYHVSPEEADHLLERLQGNCDVCGHDGSHERLCVDHCHTTGKVRGILCQKCNRALGQLGDDVASIERLLTYLTAA